MLINNVNVFDDIKTYDDLFFDIVFSDPPYNLSSEWYINGDGRYNLRKRQSDFLNKWDGLDGDDLDLFFQESFRVLKHGGYCIMYGMDRQLGPFNYYAVKNGFEVCQSLYWFQMANFPKAVDVSKQLEKSGQLSNKYDGYKYSKAPLKQVVECIMVFHKPCLTGSYIGDIMKYESGDMDLLKYCPKAAQSERNAGCEKLEEKEVERNGACQLRYDYSSNPDYEVKDSVKTRNHHPTIKPMKLNAHILNLFKTPNDDRIYIPFCGVCSEVIPAVQLGYDVYGCELNEEYYQIGMARCDHWLKNDLFI